ncbi:hypothetical protein I4U23_015027 [Adineta vaga]|nr:hypothetical protein I4U23_015027 [Adineta vaga]
MTILGILTICINLLRHSGQNINAVSMLKSKIMKSSIQFTCTDNPYIIFNTIQEEIAQLPTQIHLPIQLSISIYSLEERCGSPFINFYNLRLHNHFTHLDINCLEISVSMLMQFIELLPNLDLLKVLHLSPIPEDWLTISNIEI